jgi:hypothetical protein
MTVFGFSRIAFACVMALGLTAAGNGRPKDRSSHEPPAQAPRKLTWNTMEFAILKFNDAAPNSWNIYHSEKKGVLLVRLWKRYLLVQVLDEEVYDLDPDKIKVNGDALEWSYADIPDKPIDTPDWKERNGGPLDVIRFRLGKNGHYLELQIPMAPNGRPMY